MRISELYKYGILGIVKLLLLSFVCVIVAGFVVITLPIWWLKCIQRLLDILASLIERIINL